MWRTLMVSAALAWGTSSYAYDVACGIEDTTVDTYWTGDFHMMRHWGCTSSNMSLLWGGLRTGDYWARWTYYGFHDACNTARPLARTLNSMWALYYSQLWGRYACSDCGGSMMNMGWDYVTARLNRTWPSCYNDWWAQAHSPSFAPNHVELKRQFFYRANMIERAATLVHEVRHYDGYKHNRENNQCSWGGSCDSHWGYNGSRTYETLWLWWFYARATYATSFIRNQAGISAQTYADRTFQQPPGYLIYTHCIY